MIYCLNCSHVREWRACDNSDAGRADTEEKLSRQDVPDAPLLHQWPLLHAPPSRTHTCVSVKGTHFTDHRASAHLTHSLFYAVGCCESGPFSQFVVSPGFSCRGLSPSLRGQSPDVQLVIFLVPEWAVWGFGAGGCLGRSKGKVVSGEQDFVCLKPQLWVSEKERERSRAYWTFPNVKEGKVSKLVISIDTRETITENVNSWQDGVVV